MSHILEGLDQSPPSVKSIESEAYSNEPEGSQNGRPHFESLPMRIVMIPVHRDVPELVHNNWKSPRKLNQRTAHWHEELQDYYFELQHTPGRLHTAANALSQRFGSDEGKDDNQEVTMIPEKTF